MVKRVTAKRVTLRIEDLDTGDVEAFAFECRGPYVVTLVFRAGAAAVAAHPDEVTALTAAAKLLADAAATAAGVGDEVTP